MGIENEDLGDSELLPSGKPRYEQLPPDFFDLSEADKRELKSLACWLECSRETHWIPGEPMVTSLANCPEGQMGDYLRAEEKKRKIREKYGME